MSVVPAVAAELGPTFWLWGIAILFQTAVFAAVGTWAISRFINRLISEIRKEIQSAVAELESADKTVAKETGDTIGAMRQHIQNLEREFLGRLHSIEKKMLEDLRSALETFVRRDSFLSITQKLENAIERLDGKIDEIRDRLPAS